MYSSIHYDVIALSNGPIDSDTLIFEGDTTEMDRLSLELAQEWKDQHKYTDLASFTLTCAICKKGLVGQKDAQQHAMETGHAEFAEYV